MELGRKEKWVLQKKMTLRFFLKFYIAIYSALLLNSVEFDGIENRIFHILVYNIKTSYDHWNK